MKENQPRNGYDLSTTIGKLTLRNPVMPASGTFGYAAEYAPFIDLNRLGAIVVKCITPKPRMGSFPHRLAEAPSGTVCTIGLQNVGIDRFIEEKMPRFRVCRRCLRTLLPMESKLHLCASRILTRRYAIPFD